MSTEVGGFFATLELKSDENSFKKGQNNLKDLEKDFKSFGGGLKTFGGITLGVTTALAAVTAATVGLATATAEANAKMQQMADQAGMTNEQAQNLKLTFSTFGGDFDAALQGAIKFNTEWNNLEWNKANTELLTTTYGFLQVKPEGFQKLSTEKKIEGTLNAALNVAETDPTKARTLVSQALPDFLGLFNAMIRDGNTYRQELEKGKSIDQTSEKERVAAANANYNFQILNGAITEVGNKVGSVVAVAIEPFAKDLLKWLQENKAGIDSFAHTVADAMTTIAKTIENLAWFFNYLNPNKSKGMSYQDAKNSLVGDQSVFNDPSKVFIGVINLFKNQAQALSYQKLKNFDSSNVSKIEAEKKFQENSKGIELWRKETEKPELEAIDLKRKKNEIYPDIDFYMSGKKTVPEYIKSLQDDLQAKYASAVEENQAERTYAGQQGPEPSQFAETLKDVLNPLRAQLAIAKVDYPSEIGNITNEYLVRFHENFKNLTGEQWSVVNKSFNDVVSPYKDVNGKIEFNFTGMNLDKASVDALTSNFAREMKLDPRDILVTGQKNSQNSSGTK